MHPASPRRYSHNRALHWISIGSAIALLGTAALASDARRTSPAVGSPTTLTFPEVGRLSSELRASIDPLCAKDAWTRFYADRNASARDESGRLAAPVAGRELPQQSSELELLAQSFPGPARIAAVESLRDPLAEQLASHLKDQVERRELTGKRIALVIGRFGLTPAHPDFPSDAQLETLLVQIGDSLAAKSGLQNQFTLVRRPETTVTEIIAGIGSGSDAWLKTQDLFSAQRAGPLRSAA